MPGAVVYDDLIVEILAKLPVKSLLRFHCVCKTWYSIISHPQFSNNLHQMRRPSVLICENHREFSTITLESLLKIKDGALTPLSLPWETEPGQNVCLGSCNGLVCVDHKSSSSGDKSSLIIWNPSTRKFKRLPRPGHYYSIEHTLRTCAWFGYDESIDDYKLVWLTFSDLAFPKVVEVYVFTLKSNTWRKPALDRIAVAGLNLSGPRDGINPISSGVLSNGAIHWISEYFGTEVCILVFDLATEKLGLLEFSHAPFSRTSLLRSLEGGCLCLCTYDYEDGCTVSNLWMMKEYGVDSSWTKLLSIPIKLEFTPVCPILFAKEGKEMVVVCTMTGAYHGRIVKLRVEEGGEKVKNEETLLGVPRNPFESIVLLHIEESLVSIAG